MTQPCPSKEEATLTQNNQLLMALLDCFISLPLTGPLK